MLQLVSNPTLDTPGPVCIATNPACLNSCLTSEVGVLGLAAGCALSRWVVANTFSSSGSTLTFLQIKVRRGVGKISLFCLCHMQACRPAGSACHGAIEGWCSAVASSMEHAQEAPVLMPKIRTVCMLKHRYAKNVIAAY